VGPAAGENRWRRRESNPTAKGAESTEDLAVPHAEHEPNRTEASREPASGATPRFDSGEPKPEPCVQELGGVGIGSVNDPIETLLAKAILAATAAAQWEVVQGLATELRARREAKT
jgi:hypothetical protein